MGTTITDLMNNLCGSVSNLNMDEREEGPVAAPAAAAAAASAAAAVSVALDVLSDEPDCFWLCCAALSAETAARRRCFSIITWVYVSGCLRFRCRIRFSECLPAISK